MGDPEASSSRRGRTATVPDESRGREDPRVTRSRELILTAARSSFAESGYEATTVDTIAARAGISKRTIYNIYGDKDALFRASVEASFEIAEEFTRHLEERVSALEDLEEELPSLALRLARDTFRGPVVPLRRLLAHEAARFPDLAEEYRDRAPFAVIRALAAGFTTLQDRGLVTVDDPDLAAEQFAYLVLGPELDRRMLGAPPSPAQEIDRHVLAAVSTFLRAHQPPAS